MSKTLKKILFFTADAIATDDEIKAGYSIRAQFRNAKRAALENVESCDYVAGEIPENYRKFPVYGDAPCANPYAGAETVTEDEPPVEGGSDQTDQDETGAGEGEAGEDQTDQDDQETENTDAKKTGLAGMFGKK